MRSLFGSSPHRVRNNSSRDSADATRGESNKQKRPSFAFMKYSPDRRSSASMRASREHARQIALQLSMNEPEAAPTTRKQKSTTKSRQPRQPAAAHQSFQPAFPEPSAFDDFNPFGHDVTTTNSFGSHAAAKALAPAPPQEDFFAPTPPAPKPAATNYQRKSSTASISNRSSTSSAGNFPMRESSFDNESVASSGAYDMDFLPMQRDSFQQQPPRQRSSNTSRGRPPRNRAPSSEVSFGSSSTPQWSQQPQQQQAAPPSLAAVGSSSSQTKSMSTFPSNSSMQSAFAGQTVATPPAKAVNMTPTMAAGGGAAARRRMRSQLRRHGSSGGSLAGSDTCSFDGTPPASPNSTRHRQVISSNGSVGSSATGGAARNRVANYTIGAAGNNNNWQNSPSPSMRGGASVCSSTAESDIDLFESQNENGGFTFDAFGLDASEIEREVQEAMQAIAGTSGGGSEFGGFMAAANTTTAASTNKSTVSKPQDTSTDDFAPQAWDSPPGSRRSTPTPKEEEEEDDGFVDGFRVSKPSPLPLISVHRESPPSSERSSSLSSITDHNTDHHGGPRRNVFKEKAGFMSSSNNRPRPSPGQTPKKQWKPPPGAVKMLTPPRHELQQRLQPQQEKAQPQVQASVDEDTDNYWKDHLNQIPDMLKVNNSKVESKQQKFQSKKEQQPSSQPSAAKKWQSAASKFSSPTPQPKSQPSAAKRFAQDALRKREEEKKDDEDEDRDNHTDTTSAMTTVVSEPQPASPRRPSQVDVSKQQKQEPKLSQQNRVAALRKENIEKIETRPRVEEDRGETPKKTLSPQEQRKKELEELRNGTASGSPPGFKSLAALHHVHHDAKQLKPQQERANECSDQRTSFASLRERLKSPGETEPQSKAPLNVNPLSSPQSTFQRAQSPLSTSAKSEVGVSSFTRQKMKIAAMSSSASKSEANFKSPRSSQHEVNAVLNRMRGMNSKGLSTPTAGATPATASSAPTFVGVKLRKTPSSAGLDGCNSDEEMEYQETQRQPHVQQQQQEQDQEHPQRHSPERAVSPKRLSYRERREMELRRIQAQEQTPPRGSPSCDQQQTCTNDHLTADLSQQVHLPRGSPTYQLQQTNSQDHSKQQTGMSGSTQSLPQSEEPAPKKLSYRERRELELAKERETKEKLEQEQKANEPQKRDVADLIRRRIAANKTKPSNSPTSSEDSQQQALPLGRDRLRPTGRSVDEQVQSSWSASSSGDYGRRSSFAQGDEADADQQDDQRGYERSESQDYNSFPDDEQRTSPRHSTQLVPPEPSQPIRHSSVSPRHSQSEPMSAHRTEVQNAYHHQEEPPPTASAGGLSALHAQLKQKQEMYEEEAHQQQPQPPKPAASAGGLSALHAQLKQLKVQRSSEEEESSSEAGNEPSPSNEPKSAPRRIRELVEGKTTFEKLEVATAHSQSSDQHSSPTRTPKATYAMLNAFLHGRDTVADEAPAADQSVEQDEEAQPPGSPPKASHASAAASIPDGRSALKDDPKYARYFTMLKIGMPMDVVKHAMIRDNVDPGVMDGDHNKPECIGIPLKDDPKYAKYFKMLKIGMPMEAVKHSMERDGLDSHIMDQDHNLPADTSKGKQEDGPKEKDSHRRARLHWKPLRDIRRNSLWAKIDEDPELDNIEIDEEEFAELFQAELQTDAQQSKKGKRINSPRKGAAVRVIDPKRANNGGIILARLKMSHDDMADVVDRIDENCMTAEQIEHIIEYLPTREERRALETYMLEGGQDAAEKFDGLCECEKFMVSMMTVKHAKRKVRALLFKLQFESCLEALYQETHIVETSCDELSNSVRLRQLLGIVLTFGNRLNTAGKGKKKKAGAFTLDSLLKLNQAKAFDKKTTFLQYIVLIVNRNNELLLRFRDDLPTVFKADKVFWDQCISDLEEVENQLENVRRIALYQARQAAKFRRKKKKHHEGDDDEESLTDLSLSLEEEVEALRATPIGLFTLSAIKKVSFLRDRVEGTKVKFNKLLEYFGEDEKHMQPHELFNIIVKFCREFDKAKEQVMADEKKKKREERKRHSSVTAANPTKNKTPTRRPQTGMLLRASAMQPNAGRLIQDMERNGAAATPPEQLSTPQARNPAPQHYSESVGQKRHDQTHQSSLAQSQQRYDQARSPHSRPVQRRESAPVQHSQLHRPPSNEHTYQRSESAPLQSQGHDQAYRSPQPMPVQSQGHDQSHRSPQPVPVQSQGHDQSHRSPQPVPQKRHDQAHSHPVQSHGHDQRSAPNESAYQRSESAPAHSHGQAVNIPIQSSPPRSSDVAVQPASRQYEGQRETPADQRMDLASQAAESTEASQSPSSAHRERPIHETNQRQSSQHLGVDSQSLALDDVIPPGMQDQGRLEVSYGSSHQMHHSQAINPSGSTESQTSTLRRKARMRGRMAARSSNSQPEDPPAYTMTQEREAGLLQMHRQSSAPVVGSNPVADPGLSRRSSLPLENSSGVTSSSVTNNTQPASNTTSSTLMRNKLRKQRMMERRHRGRTSPGRTSPTPTHNA